MEILNKKFCLLCSLFYCSTRVSCSSSRDLPLCWGLWPPLTLIFQVELIGVMGALRSRYRCECAFGIVIHALVKGATMISKSFPSLGDRKGDYTL